MKKLLFAVTFLFLTTGSLALAETCQECMSQCPHETRDIKPCDLGCKEVCPATETKEEMKFRRCSECMEPCPHLTRDLKPCDRGCPKFCDTASLVRLLHKAKSELRECRKNADGVPKQTVETEEIDGKNVGNVLPPSKATPDDEQTTPTKRHL
ncbi:MAG: hypothetical protein HY074_08320 [Deltaproteobacteria bacterium]|nr:hypothetical protein [Deltaproteobacteria bacterium]